MVILLVVLQQKLEHSIQKISIFETSPFLRMINFAFSLMYEDLKSLLNDVCVLQVHGSIVSRNTVCNK